jgi:hypothetical protein
MEYQMPLEMPNLKGAGAEFIPNNNLPHFENEVIQLDQIAENEFVIGHLYGGIQSPTTNAFTSNQTSATIADPTVYEVKLLRNPDLQAPVVNGANPFSFTVAPNPTVNDTVRLQFHLPYLGQLDYFITNLEGKILDDGEIEGVSEGNNAMNFSLENAKATVVLITFIFDNKFYYTQKVIRQ